MTLGNRLKEARQRKGMSLRQVEKVTQISNGYVSLLESDHIKQPSPHHLMRLSETYEIDYAELMALAGYVVPTALGADPAVSGQAMRFISSVGGGAVRAASAAPSVADLTPDERSKVEEYIAFLRSRRAGSRGSGSSGPTGPPGSSGHDGP